MDLKSIKKYKNVTFKIHTLRFIRLWKESQDFDFELFKTFPTVSEAFQVGKVISTEAV